MAADVRFWGRQGPGGSETLGKMLLLWTAVFIKEAIPEFILRGLLDLCRLARPAVSSAIRVSLRV